MSRALVALAIDSGIPPSVWLGEGEKTVVTAFALMEQARKDAERR